MTPQSYNDWERNMDMGREWYQIGKNEWFPVTEL